MQSEARVPLSGQRGEGQYATVDLDLLDVMMSCRWHLNSGGYASSATYGLMHRFVINLTRDELASDPDLLVDHLDGNRLNNTRRNLAPKTSKGNAKNRTNDPIHEGFTGVKKEGDVFWTVHRKIKCYVHQDARMCALCYDSIVTYCYGPGKRLNDLKSKEPLGIAYWNLSVEVIAKLMKFKAKYTDFIGVKKSRGGWRATIVIDLGEFPSDVEAAQAYDEAIRAVYRNPKAKQLNFP